MLPDAGNEGRCLPVSGLSTLPGISWSYREVLRDVRVDISPPLADGKDTLQAPYASIFHVRPLKSDGHPQVDRKSNAEIGIMVLFLRETDEQRKVRREGLLETGRAMAYEPEGTRGVSSAMVALVRAALMALDADQIPAPVGWRVRWSKAYRSTLEVFGANVYLPCRVQNENTVCYGLPEQKAQAPPVPVEVTWVDEHRPHSKPISAEATLRFVDKVVDDGSNLVTLTRFSVHPKATIGGSSRELERVNYIVFRN